MTSSQEADKKIIIIGAGPAGLTAALEILRHTNYIPIVLEKSDQIGGLSKTVEYKGNHLDIGGHRFYSKSEEIMQWWQQILPSQGLDTLDSDSRIGAELLNTPLEGPHPDEEQKMLLLRKRRSRIFFQKRLFAYPLTLSADTLKNLGILKAISFVASYLRARLMPTKPERTLEDFFINRFGRAIYGSFFRSYSEKVWGVPCHQISSRWGAQRIKQLSLFSALKNAVKKRLSKAIGRSHKFEETSLIEHFLYPKLGPGQMWNAVADEVRQKGGTILCHRELQKWHYDGKSITGVTILNNESDESEFLEGEFFISSMPLKDLCSRFTPELPESLRSIGEGLLYRDFITVGVLLKNFNIPGSLSPIRDNWIYIHDPSVRMSRLQIFNNWSPHLVAQGNLTWVGLEFHCSTTDAFWKLEDHEVAHQAQQELVELGFATAEDIVDSTVIRAEKAYPAYFGSYEKISELQSFLNSIPNLFPVGRNGMHRYNNQDHSMITAINTVRFIANKEGSKANVWKINADQSYIERYDKSTVGKNNV